MVTKVVSLIAGVVMAESQVVEVLYKYGGLVPREGVIIDDDISGSLC